MIPEAKCVECRIRRIRFNFKIARIPLDRLVLSDVHCQIYFREKRYSKQLGDD